MAKAYSASTQRVLRAVQNNLSGSRGKGALVVRALLAGMTDEQVFMHLVERGEVPSQSTIQSYRRLLRMLGHDVTTDKQLRRAAA